VVGADAECKHDPHYYAHRDALMRTHAYYSVWCATFQAHLKRKGLTQEAFARMVGRPQQTIQAFLSGRNKPPLELIIPWADALKLRGAEREQFVTLAYEPHTPPAVWSMLEDLQAQVAELTRQRRACTLREQTESGETSG
jgi:transcriptional regulator with XRE-family HTH domain